MLVAIYPLVFVVIGLLMYALAGNPKLTTIGLWVFVTAFLVLMLTLAKQTFRIG